MKGRCDAAAFLVMFLLPALSEYESRENVTSVRDTEGS